MHTHMHRYTQIRMPTYAHAHMHSQEVARLMDYDEWDKLKNASADDH